MTSEELTDLVKALNSNKDFHWNLVTEGTRPTELICFFSGHVVFNINFSFPDIMKLTFQSSGLEINRQFYHEIQSADLAFQCQILMLAFTEGFVLGVG